MKLDTHKDLSDFLVAKDACVPARYWAVSGEAFYKTPQGVWDACHRGDWMIWALEALEAPIELTVPIAVAILSSRTESWNRRNPESTILARTEATALEWVTGVAALYELEFVTDRLNTHTAEPLIEGWSALYSQLRTLNKMSTAFKSKELYQCVNGAVFDVMREELGEPGVTAAAAFQQSAADFIRAFVPWYEVVRLASLL